MTVPEQVLSLVRGAARITVLTGAGMSAESGLPTFRDVQTGLWARYDPMTLATLDAFEEDPDLVWGWYLKRAQMIRSVQPNAGHVALADLGRSKDVRVITQNVDDLHERAGSPVLAHVHGSLFDFRCVVCSNPYSGEIVIPDEITDRIPPPRCGHCGDRIRPGIVWFGEALPQDAFQRAVQASFVCDLMIVIGTSGTVHPAAGLPSIAASTGKPCLEINPDSTALSRDMDYCWRVSAAEGLPQLVAELGERSIS